MGINPIPSLRRTEFFQPNLLDVTYGIGAAQKFIILVISVYRAEARSANIEVDNIVVSFQNCFQGPFFPVDNLPGSAMNIEDVHSIEIIKVKMVTLKIIKFKLTFR